MPQLALGVGVPEYSFLSEATLGAGIPYALPEANLVSWQTIFASAPGAVSVQLQGSIDGITWVTIDSSTVVGGELRTIQTGAKFLRAFFTSQTGGGLHSVLIVCHKIIQALLTSSDMSGNFVQAAGSQWLLQNGTIANPSLAFINDLNLGLYRAGTDILGIGGALITKELSRVGGVLYSAGSVGNVGTAETDLGTFTLPANTLDVNRKGVRVTYVLTCAGNANSKNIALYFGGSNYVARGNTDNGFNYKIVSEIYRTGVGNQVINTTQILGVTGTAAAIISSFNNGAQDLTTALIIKITGTSAVASNDIFLQNMLVELLN